MIQAAHPPTRMHPKHRRTPAGWVLGLLSLCLPACDAAGPDMDVTVTPLETRPLPELPGKEGEMILVEYEPGAADPVHRHHAHAFVYVLEGSVVMQVAGGEEVTLTPGQTFYEAPDDVHVVGRNASSTSPARFVVFMIKDAGAPVLVPEHGSGHAP